MTEPTRSLEIEVTFDVDDDTVVPDFSALPGVAEVRGPEHRELDAGYLDTADLALAQAGVAVRRREGGPDAGWHIKGPLVDGARIELHWPLGAVGDPPPAALVAALPDISGLSADRLGEFGPIARIRNHRAAFTLTDVNGVVLAEFVDDRVRALDVRAGVERAWREWEFELGPGVPPDERHSILDAATQLADAAGARPAASASKLARTLGH